MGKKQNKEYLYLTSASHALRSMASAWCVADAAASGLAAMPVTAAAKRTAACSVCSAKCWDVSEVSCQCPSTSRAAAAAKPSQEAMQGLTGKG
jgi:hypothetical protein